MGVLAEVQKGLEKAHDHSTREGKWSTVGEVRSYETETSLTRLRDLVSDGAATEKKVGGVLTKLFKPTRAGGGGGASGLGDKAGDRDKGGRDEGGKPRGKGPGKKPHRPRRGGKPKPHKHPGKKPPRKPPRRTHEKPRRDLTKPKGKGRRPTRVKQRGSAAKGVGSVIGQGVGTLLVGGMGGSGTAGAGVGRLPMVPKVM